MRVAVAQLGARRHYLVPRALDRAAILDRLYTDICGVAGWPVVLSAVPAQLRPAPMRRLVDRVPTGIDRSRITAFSSFGLKYRFRCRRARDTSQLTAAWLWGGRRFCELVLGHGLHRADAVYAFNSAALELLRAARERGLTAVLDQSIAPRSIEREILRQEEKRWPGWEPAIADDRYLGAYCERELEEWELASHIVCGSEFVKDGIAAGGGPADRCVVIPVAADPAFSLQSRQEHTGPLRVLFMGTVGLRKGVPYLLGAAKCTSDVATYRLVGPVNVGPRAEVELRRYVDLAGPVQRSMVLDQYRWADVLVLPSLCEGSANVTHEALATGLPVICTRSAGSVVRDGVDGYIIPIRSVSELGDRIRSLGENRHKLREMAHNARLGAAGRSGIDRYGERLVTALGSPAHG